LEFTLKEKKKKKDSDSESESDAFPSILVSKIICEEINVKGFVIFSGEQGDFFALDYNANTENPPVVCLIQEVFDGPFVPVQIAPDFGTFLEKLQNREEDCLVIAIKSDIEAEKLEETIKQKLIEAKIEIKTEEQMKEAYHKKKHGRTCRF